MLDFWRLCVQPCDPWRSSSTPSSSPLPVRCCPWTMTTLSAAATWECFHPTTSPGDTHLVSTQQHTNTHTSEFPHLHLFMLHSDTHKQSVLNPMWTMQRHLLLIENSLTVIAHNKVKKYPESRCTSTQHHWFSTGAALSGPSLCQCIGTIQTWSLNRQ